MAEIYNLDKYRGGAVVDHSSTSMSEGEYQVMGAGEVRVRRPLPRQHPGAGEEGTKYLSQGEDFELSPDLLMDHSWRETKRRTPYETVAECSVAKNVKRPLMLELFRNEMYQHAEMVAERLEHLDELEQEEENEEPISLDSVATFLSFLVAFSSRAEPGITVTPDGNIYATWKAEGGRHCGIEFAPMRAAKLVLMVPGEAETGSGVHIAGMMGSADLERTLRLHGVHAW